MINVTKSTIDSVMKNYYNRICSDKLLDKNIDIDDTLEVNNSSQQYIQEFALFLNNIYYQGYIISESIFSKLLDIINYEGYEYKLFKAYENILSDAIRYTNNISNELLTPVEAKDFVIKYSEIYNNDNIDIDSVPCYGDEDLEKPLSLVTLEQENYPIDVMFKDIINNKIKDTIQLAETSYVIYKNNISAYKYLVNNTNNLACIFFLLDNDDNDSLDILLSKMTSLSNIADLIDFYNSYTYLEDNGIGLKFSDTANNNIRRFIEVVTINMQIEQTAMFVGANYGLWREYDNINSHKLSTLTIALDLYDSNNDRFKLLNPVDYLSKVKEFYSDDSYFYIRNTLLNIDISVFCDNFELLYKYTIEALKDFNKTSTLISECINGFVQLRVLLADQYLMYLHDKLIQLCKAKSNNNLLLEVDNNKLTSRIVDIENIETENSNDNEYYEYMEQAIKSIEIALLSRYSEKSYDTIPYFDDLRDDGIKTFTGSIVSDIRTIELSDKSITIEDEFLDEDLDKCDKKFAIFEAKYINISKPKDKLELSFIVGDNNENISINLGEVLPGKVLVGLYEIPTSKFITANLNVDPDDNTIIRKLIDYTDQIQYTFTRGDVNIINTNRTIK